MLTQGVGYACQALAVIALSEGKPRLIKEVAEEADVPAPYLAKIVQTLAKRGVVSTQRGVGGGATLSRPADKITLFQVCEALDDPIVLKRCMLGTDECSDERACPCHSFWTDHRGQYQHFLRTTTIADMARFESARAARAIGSTAQRVKLSISPPKQ